MRITDFGQRDAPLLAAGGILSNAEALEAFAAIAGATPVVLTGDLAGYCADPARVWAQVRALGWPVVAGNVERQIASDADNCGCGFSPGSVCDRLSAEWYAHARRAAKEEDRAWMASLPDIGVVTVDGRRHAVLHGGATNIARYVWPTSHVDDFRREIAAIKAAVGEVDAVIAGHSGIAFQREIDGVLWINAGALGMPPHDARPETRFAEIGGGGAVIRRLSYDHSGARQAMGEAGLDQGYDAALSTGIWPSEDVLPDALRRFPDDA